MYERRPSRSRRLHERRKRLNKFKRNYLYESIMNKNEIIDWLEEMGIENYTINDDGSVDANVHIPLAVRV